MGRRHHQVVDLARQPRCRNRHDEVAGRGQHRNTHPLRQWQLVDQTVTPFGKL